MATAGWSCKPSLFLAAQYPASEVTKPVSDFLDSIPLGYVYYNYTDWMRQQTGMQSKRRALPSMAAGGEKQEDSTRQLQATAQ